MGYFSTTIARPDVLDSCSVAADEPCVVRWRFWDWPGRTRRVGDEGLAAREMVLKGSSEPEIGLKWVEMNENIEKNNS